MGRIKTVNSSVFITFAIILIFLGVVMYNYDFEAGLDRGTGIIGLGDYIYKSDEVVVGAGPDEITSLYAYLANEEVQIRFEYGQFFLGAMRSDCSEPGEWADEVAVPSNEINLNEQEIADFTTTYSEIKPEYYVDEEINLDETGFGEPAACVVIRTQSTEYFLQIGNEHSHSGYKYLKVIGVNRVYLVSNSIFTQLTSLTDL